MKTPVLRAAALRLWWLQDAHSIFLTVAAVVLSITLVVDFVTASDHYGVLPLTAMLACCIVLGGTAFVQGRRVRRGVAMLAIGAFALAQTFFQSGLSDASGSVAGLQELPILGLYLGWFVRPKFARTLMCVTVTMIVLAMLTNPAFAPNGELGVPTAVHGVLAGIFCFEVGSYLWRRSNALANTDPLTRVLNRRGFFEELAADLKSLSKRRRSLALVVVDFDGFKRINDTLGHAAGDRVLRETVAEWKQDSRARDLIGRSGGDEFALLLRDVDDAGVRTVMQRLQDASAHAWSWGGAIARSDDTPDSLFARADLALYAQKAERKGEA